MHTEMYMQLLKIAKQLHEYKINFNLEKGSCWIQEWIGQGTDETARS